MRREDAGSSRPIRCLAVEPRHQSGASAIEFGLLAPLLLIMLTGVVEVGIASYQAMQVQAAVEAGILYAIQNVPTSITPISAAFSSAIITAVQNATGTPGITATPVPLAFCGCPSTTAGTGVVSQVNDCTTKCPDTTLPGQYVTVSAALSHQTIMPYLNLHLPATLTASSTVRLQ
jgi:Flp pilus assembly protein TadG